MALSVGKIVGVVIALLLIGILLPIGLGESGVSGLLGISTGDATVDALVPLIGVMAVVGMMIAFVPRGGKSD
jgi:hypothetical protein